MTRTAACKIPTVEVGALQAGDVVFFSPTNLVGTICSFFQLPWRLHHRYAHVGIVGEGPTTCIVSEWGCGESEASYAGHAKILVESTVDDPLGKCLWAKGPKRGVQAHYIVNRLALHNIIRHGKTWVLKLRKPLSDTEKASLLHGLYDLRHKGYDLVGAARARDLLFGAPIRQLRRWLGRPTQNGSSYFCSEFAAKGLGIVGRFHGQPDQFSPKSLATALVQRGVCEPPEEIKL